MTLQKNDKTNVAWNKQMQKALCTYRIHCWGEKNQELNNVFRKIKFSSYWGREEEAMTYTFTLLVLTRTVK